MLKDMMTGFELRQPTDLESALAMVAELRDRGWLLAGGHDSLNWFKDRAKQPSVLVDLEGVNELRGVREVGAGLEIGAMTTLTELETNALIRERYPLLADAASKVASPQIRNSGTLGGNVCQDTRCWYYRMGVSCYRAGGNICYAAAPDAQNREHAIFGASRCVAVTPSDCAVALVALDAQMVIRRRGGQRVVPARSFFMGPAKDIERMTVLEPGEVLTAVRLPSEWANAEHYFEKVTDRNSWDFALVSIAAAFKTTGEVIDDARVVCGAVSCVPRRMEGVERTVRGQTRSEQLAEAAGAVASRGAEPLTYNHFKIPLVENLVKRAVRG